MSVSDLLHGALFVRDAAGLRVTDGPLVPPPLEGVVPDMADRLTSEEAAQAGEAWAGWWQVLVGLELGKDQAPRSPEMIQEHLANLTRTADPPGWVSLRDRPGLQAAAQIAFEDARSWADQALAPLKLPNQTRPVFRWEWIRDVAKQVANDHGVGLDAVSASAQVLVVRGKWWSIPAPGVVLCSAVAAEDEATGRDILRRVFESTITV
jgi:hypothetical protein